MRPTVARRLFAMLRASALARLPHGAGRRFWSRTRRQRRSLLSHVLRTREVGICVTTEPIRREAPDLEAPGLNLWIVVGVEVPTSSNVSICFVQVVTFAQQHCNKVTR